MTRWTPAHSTALVSAPVLGVNFHHVSPEGRAEMTRALTRAARFGPSLELGDASAASTERSDAAAAELGAPPAGPKIFVAFYDGFRETGLFGADLCFRLGIRACFFPLFTCTDPGRGELTDDDLRDIGSVHEIGFHSSSHVRADQVSPDQLDAEVVAPMTRIELVTGRRPRVAAWRGGARFDGSLGNRSLRELGVRQLVSNWSVEAIPA